MELFLLNLFTKTCTVRDLSCFYQNCSCCRFCFCCCCCCLPIIAPRVSSNRAYHFLPPPFPVHHVNQLTNANFADRHCRRRRRCRFPHFAVVGRHHDHHGHFQFFSYSAVVAVVVRQIWFLHFWTSLFRHLPPRRRNFFRLLLFAELWRALVRMECHLTRDPTMMPKLSISIRELPLVSPYNQW